MEQKLTRLLICFLALLVAAQVANAESSKSSCAAMAPSMLQASDAMGKLAQPLLNLDFNDVASQFEGAEAEAFQNLAKSQKELEPQFNNFLLQLEAAALLLRKCAR